MGQRLLLRWAEEQWAGALQRLKATQEAVHKLKVAAKAAAVKEKDTRFTLEVCILSVSDFLLWSTHKPQKAAEAAAVKEKDTRCTLEVLNQTMCAAAALSAACTQLLLSPAALWVSEREKPSCLCLHWEHACVQRCTTSMC